jgi:Domain of unknown function (DUF5060)/Putative collagen-binding domain of a collagenase/Protein of unknown function (DUF4038)
MPRSHSFLLSILLIGCLVDVSYESLLFAADEPISSAGTSATSTVSLYGMFELTVSNSRNYRNPFDFAEITLEGHFVAPSGKGIKFFGFYDGDGKGGQVGSVWKLRFMPDQVGRWRYVYHWSDGTPGGSGFFEVVSGISKGPLRVLDDNRHYFRFANGEIFYPRAYYLSGLFYADSARLWKDDGIDKYFGGQYRFNLVVTTFWQGQVTWDNGWNAWGPGYTYNGFYPLLKKPHLFSWLTDFGGTDYSRYDIKSWFHLDQVLKYLMSKHLIWYNFDGIFPNEGGALHAQSKSVQENFVKYYIARIAPYPYVLNNIAFEYDEFLSDTQVSEIAALIKRLDPFDHPLTVHAQTTPPDFSWADYTAVQIDAGRAGEAQAAYKRVIRDYTGRRKPVACIECSWEGAEDRKLTKAQVRHGAWGQTLGGSFHVYAEQFLQNGQYLYGDGGAFQDLEIMHDFIESIEFWKMYPDPGVVSGNQQAIAMVEPGNEYVVYLQTGGAANVDLSEASGSLLFEWLNPREGGRSRPASIDGGKFTTFTAPDNLDWVLHIYRFESQNNKASRPMTIQ